MSLTSCLNCQVLFEKGQKGSFWIRSLKLHYAATRLCPVCEEARIRRCFLKCRRLKLVRPNSSYSLLTIDWTKYYELRRKVDVSNSFIKILLALRVVVLKNNGSNGNCYYGVRREELKYIAPNNKFAVMVFCDEEDAVDWAKVSGSQVIMYDHQWLEVHDHKPTCAACG